MVILALKLQSRIVCTIPVIEQQVESASIFAPQNVSLCPTGATKKKLPKQLFFRYQSDILPHASRAHDVRPHALSQNSSCSIARSDDKKTDNHIH